MRPIDRWAHMMSSFVQISQVTQVDTYGKPTYGASTIYRAHLTQGNKLVVGMNGQQVMADISAHLMARVPLLPTSRVTLSTGDVGSTESYMVNPRVVAVEERFDQMGLHHTVVYMQWAPRGAL